jgi:hypothetical protein
MLAEKSAWLEQKTGEKRGSFEGFGKDDLIIADRAYGTLTGIE